MRAQHSLLEIVQLARSPCPAIGKRFRSLLVRSVRHSAARGHAAYNTRDVGRVSRRGGGAMLWARFPREFLIRGLTLWRSRDFEVQLVT